MIEQLSNLGHPIWNHSGDDRVDELQKWIISELLFFSFDFFERKRYWNFQKEALQLRYLLRRICMYGNSLLSVSSIKSNFLLPFISKYNFQLAFFSIKFVLLFSFRLRFPLVQWPSWAKRYALISGCTNSSENKAWILQTPVVRIFSKQGCSCCCYCHVLWLEKVCHLFEACYTLCQVLLLGLNFP